MTTTISPELEKQIDQEAKDLTTGFQDNDDYESGIIQGYKEGYEDAGNNYGHKWEQAEAMVDRMKGVIEELIGIAYPNIPILKKANQALTDYNTYKKSKDADRETT